MAQAQPTALHIGKRYGSNAFEHYPNDFTQVHLQNIQHRIIATAVSLTFACSPCNVAALHWDAFVSPETSDKMQWKNQWKNRSQS